MARLTLALQPKVKKGTLHVFKMMAGTLLTVMVPNTAMFPGKHFWETTQREAKGQVGKAVVEQLKTAMDKKVGK
ncbi:hypothetical protein [Lactiplantibacillus plantarum]|uniref:hypothetical protein n=1 Tax=Lactiplantibacillus plantarum TaxID=1590 RepID=UPI0021CB1E07|nr:hypothetical protein [Lactiplantibacillus plantarum]